MEGPESDVNTNGESGGTGEYAEPDLSEEALAAEEAKMAQAGGKEFNLQLLMHQMKSVTEGFAKNEISIQMYSDMYMEWCKMFRHLGSAIVIAFKDISDKGKIIGNNSVKFNGEFGITNPEQPEGKFLQQFVALEMQLKCIELNGENNKKIIKKMSADDVKPWMAKYTSTSRTLFRGAWFFDFLHCLIRDLCDERTAKTSKLAQKAYDTALAPHHPWALKKAAGIAMNAIKKRESFIKSVCDEQTKLTGQQFGEDNFYTEFKQLSLYCEALAASLWALCRENGFDKLP